MGPRRLLRLTMIVPTLVTDTSQVQATRRGCMSLFVPLLCRNLLLYVAHL